MYEKMKKPMNYKKPIKKGVKNYKKPVPITPMRKATKANAKHSTRRVQRNTNGG